MMTSVMMTKTRTIVKATALCLWRTCPAIRWWFGTLLRCQGTSQVPWMPTEVTHACLMRRVSSAWLIVMDANLLPLMRTWNVSKVLCACQPLQAASAKLRLVRLMAQAEVNVASPAHGGPSRLAAQQTHEDADLVWVTHTQASLQRLMHREADLLPSTHREASFVRRLTHWETGV